MARAETVTLLPLDRYFELMAVNPWHANQIQGVTDATRLRSGCDEIWDQPDREDLAWTLAMAEDMIAQQLQFFVAPRYTENEVIPFGLQGVRPDWEFAEVETEWKHVQAYGTETLTLILANASVVYSDEDGDGTKETATIGEKSGQLYGQPITSSCGICDVAVFFREADGAYDSADPRWEIRPITVDNESGELVITAHSSMFVKPEYWEITEHEDPDGWKVPDDPDTYCVEFVDLYCRSTNTQTPVCLHWDGLCTCSTSACEHNTQTACAYSTDAKRGFFIPRPASGASNVYAAATYAGRPERITVDYLSGYPLNSRTCRIDPRLERAVVKLTNVLLPEPPCNFCDEAQQRWQQDRVNVDPLTPEAASLPWDLYSRGALDCWRIVKMMALGRGSKLGRGYKR